MVLCLFYVLLPVTVIKAKLVVRSIAPWLGLQVYLPASAFLILRIRRFVVPGAIENLSLFGLFGLNLFPFS